MTALSFVRSGTATDTTVGTTLSTPAAALTAGNHVFVFVGWEATIATAITVTDTAGNTYTPIAQPTYANNGRGQWFYKLSAAGNAANVTTITLTVGVGWRNIRVLELAGSAPTAIAQTVLQDSTSQSTGVEFPAPGLDVGAGGAILFGLEAASGLGSYSYTQSSRDPLTVTVISNFADAAAAYALAPTGVVRHMFGLSGSPTSPRTWMALTVDIGGAVPTTPTGFINAQIAAEVARLPAPKLVNAQLAAEVIRRPTPNLVNAQIAVEVLRSTTAVASTARRVVFVCT